MCVYVSDVYLECNLVCVCLLSCVRDGGLEGEGDMVSCVIKAEVWEGVCVTGEMSPLHQLGHAEMLLRRSPAVTLTTKLARPIRNLLVLLYDSWELRKKRLLKSLSEVKYWRQCAACLPWTEPSMLQLQFSRSCVREGVSVRLKRSRKSLVEKLVWSAPLARSTTVPESPCLDTCLWNIRSSIVPARK